MRGLVAILFILPGLAGCATNKVASYPDTWQPAVATAPASTEAGAAVMSYAAPDRCYLIIEDKSPVVEICQEDDLIVYNPLPAPGNASIIPPQIAGVLAIQGHLSLPHKPVSVAQATGI